MEAENPAAAAHRRPEAGHKRVATPAATFTALAADAADPEVAGRLIDEYGPHTLVLCAGASPTMSPLQEQTWEGFSQICHVDVAQAFHDGFLRSRKVQPWLNKCFWMRG